MEVFIMRKYRTGKKYQTFLLIHQSLINEPKSIN